MKWLWIIFFIALTLGQLGAVSLGSGITIYSHDIVLSVLLIWWIFSQRKTFDAKLTHSIVLFIIAAVISLIANTGKLPINQLFEGSLYLVRWILYAAIYWIVTSGRLSFTFWLWGLFASGSALAGLGIVQYFFYPYLRNLYYLGWDPHLYRVFSTLLDPNFAGIIFVFTLFLGIYLWKLNRHRHILFFVQTVTLCAFFLTFSRSSYLAGILGLMIVLFHTKGLKWLLPIGVLFIGILFLLPKPDGEGVRLFRTVSTFARLGNWQRGVELIREAPIFGHGFNTLRYVQQAKGWVDESEFPSKAGAGLDNSFQFIWATTGIVGFVSYVVLLIQMFRIGRKNILLRSSLVALLVHSQFSNSLFYPWVMIWMWILVGIVERIISDT